MKSAATSPFRLDGKVALVSGGAGICGSPTVSALAEAGAYVLIASRDIAKCDELAKSIRAKGFSAEGAELDLTSETSIRKLRDQVLSNHRKLDVLVNNAVARAGGDLRSMSVQQWDDVMKVNSTGLFLSCQVFSEPMQEARSGSIINISSIYGMVGPDFSIYEGTNVTNPVNYTFAKGGMIALTRYLASFLGPFNVRVNCISPGGIQTKETPAGFVPKYNQRVPMGRMADPDDIKGPVVFFASDASRYVTGQNLAVDGGWTAI